MSNSIQRWVRCVPVWLALLLSLVGSAVAADTLNWNVRQNRVSADLKTAPLSDLLERIATVTGWQVFVEPDTARTVSAKFQDLPPGDALRLMLGDLNFALIPATNTSSRLFVFRTSRQNATQLVRPAAQAAGKTGPAAKLMANELVVRLKPGAKIEDLARQLGAKVVGRIDGLNAYRLQFDDPDAAETARDQLAGNSEVASVDNNFAIDRPPGASQVQGSGLPPPPHLELNPPPDNGRIIVGLVDTGVQPLGNDLDKFLLKPISLAGDPQLDPSSPSHGTSMAETLLRSLQVATGGKTAVQILPVDVYGPNASTSTFDVAQGIQQAVNGGAKIVNLSLGSEADSPFLRDLVQQATEKNILVIAAAGNRPDTIPTYPAAYPGVNAVTAIDQGQLASYASRGSFVSLGAPGTSIVYLNGQAYAVTGTSAAAAYTSGAAAGYMDRTGNGTDQARTYLNHNFGVSITAAPGK